jgi:RNA polymerase sigma-70 factor (ECF subfamily)
MGDAPSREDKGEPNPEILDDEIFGSVTAELHRLALVVFHSNNGDRILQPTALVNEAWLKLAGKLGQLNSKPHFFALAAKAMRQVLVDYARSESSEKRGGARKRLTLRPDALAGGSVDFDALELNDAIERLSVLNERHARVAELRLFGSLSVVEIATLLEIGEATAKRDWRMARLWLKRELS